MSGHSKWKTIAHKKEKTDAERAKLFTKLSREIIVAVREGGGDPASNSKLKEIIAKARAGNVPSDNINRVISRADGADTENYEPITYEGYGPCGVAVIVETMTDNRNRTASGIRHYFDKYGGNMGASGCVSWSFDRRGVIAVEKDGVSEDDLMMTSLDAGALDFKSGEDVFEILTEPDDFYAVRDALESAGYAFLSAEIEMVPQTWVSLTDENDIRQMQKMLDMMEDDDDVQHVWHNWEKQE